MWDTGHQNSGARAGLQEGAREGCLTPRGPCAEGLRRRDLCRGLDFRTPLQTRERLRTVPRSNARSRHALFSRCPGALINIPRPAQEPGKEPLLTLVNYLPQPCSWLSFAGRERTHGLELAGSPTAGNGQSLGLKASACDPPPALFTGHDGASSAVPRHCHHEEGGDVWAQQVGRRRGLRC